MIRSILHLANAPVLERLAVGPTLLVFDFDGTLAPIVRRPADAWLPPATRALLERIAWAYPTAVVSGRSVSDLRPRLAGLPLAAVVGNHGRERGYHRAPGRTAVERWSRQLAKDLAGTPGVVVEPKGASLSVHWRHAPRIARAKRRIRAAIADLAPAPRIVGGRGVTNLMPDDGIDKGTAVRAMARAAAAGIVLYAGDDDTDEDVFRLDSIPEIIGVRVGWSRASRARYRLRSQGEIDPLLRRLLAISAGG